MLYRWPLHAWVLAFCKCSIIPTVPWVNSDLNWLVTPALLGLICLLRMRLSPKSYAIKYCIISCNCITYVISVYRSQVYPASFEHFKFLIIRVLKLSLQYIGDRDVCHAMRLHQVARGAIFGYWLKHLKFSAQNYRWVCEWATAWNKSARRVQRDICMRPQGFAQSANWSILLMSTTVFMFQQSPSPKKNYQVMQLLLP